MACGDSDVIRRTGMSTYVHIDSIVETPYNAIGNNLIQSSFTQSQPTAKERRSYLPAVELAYFWMRTKNAYRVYYDAPLPSDIQERRRNSKKRMRRV
jgi:hypothetical protein